MSQTNITDKSFQAPVLLMVFNRQDQAVRIFESIRAAAPPRLYIAADGARKNRDGEAEKVERLRKYLVEHVDWPCEVKTLFRAENLGCKVAVSSAITWFFEHEEMGIILEDDCLPSASFYTFCNELLVRYKDDNRVWQVSGYNLLDSAYATKNSYLFSNFGFCWGWATWRRAWKHFDGEMTLWPEAKAQGITSSYPFMPSRNATWEETYQGKIDTWDYQWNFTMASNSALSAVPVENMIKNIGFTPDATHTFVDDAGRGKLENKDIVFPLVHPDFVIYDGIYEQKLLKLVSAEASLFSRGKRFAGRVVRKLFGVGKKG